jgi:hypothetical protein
MHAHHNRPDDLSEMERQLAAWAPATDGLDTDAMLFAAGRASVRSHPARFLWPTLAGCLAVLSVVLGVCLAVERNERLTLARQLELQAPTTVPPPASAVSPTVSPLDPPTAEDRPSDSLLAARQALEDGLDAWPPVTVGGAVPSGPTSPEPPVLQVGSRDVLLVP